MESTRTSYGILVGNRYGIEYTKVRRYGPDGGIVSTTIEYERRSGLPPVVLVADRGRAVTVSADGIVRSYRSRHDAERAAVAFALS